MSNRTRQCMALACLLGAAMVALAGPGHDHGTAPSAAGVEGGDWITLSHEAQRNLGLRSEPARIRPLQETLPAIGSIDPAPDRITELSSRIGGQVKRLATAEGEWVRKGDFLLEVQSSLPGNPAPVVRFEAPHAGIVTRLHVAQGSHVSPEEHLLDVVDPTVLHARAMVHEGQLRHLRIGQEARIRLAAWPDSLWNGRLLRMGGELDEASGTLPAWFELANPARVIRPNMRADFRIVTRRAEEALTVPERAVLGDQGEYFVFVVRGEGVYEKVPVVLGLTDDLGLQVLEGLQAGERVVVEGNYSMQFIPGEAEPPMALVPAHREAAEQAMDDHGDHDHGDGDHAHGDHEDEDHDHAHGDHEDKDHGHAHMDHEAGDHDHAHEDHPLPDQDHEGHDHGGGEDAAVHTETASSAGTPWLLGSGLLLSLLLNLVLLVRLDRHSSRESS